MKKFYNILICAMLLLFSANGMASDVTTQFVNNVRIDRNDSEVKLEMDILLSLFDVKSNETLIFTPVIVKGDRQMELPAVEIMGRNAYIYHLRNDNKTVTANPYLAQKVATRAERKNGIKQSVDYTATFPFESWMYGANVSLFCKESRCGCSPWGDDAFTVASIKDVYTPQYRFSFLRPEPEPVKERNVEKSAYINFYVDRFAILENYRNNRTELNKILLSVDSIADDPDCRISSIVIKGWASPEATVQHNATLSDNRAKALADWLAKARNMDRSIIEAIGCGEDWNGLRACVDATPGLLKRQSVYDVLNNELLDQDQKEYRLSLLQPADIYARIVNEFYPRLRRSDYKITYNIRNFNLEEARKVINTNPTKLSLNEMYMVAGSYDASSDEYRNAIEVAARTYPQAVPAAVNMAALRVQKGEYMEALATLLLADQNDPYIMAAKGYIYICMGDNNKAQEILSKAAEKGSEEAKHNLNELRKHLSSL